MINKVKNLSVEMGHYFKKNDTVIGSNDYLFHYTDVSALALILKNGTIKFNPLTVLDDLQEQETLDKQKYGKYCFVSSWTEDDDDNIPMWNMYTKMESGIRIKLPIYPFENYKINSNTVPDVNNIKFNKKTGETELLFSNEIFTREGFYPVSQFQQGILYKVEYTDDDEKLTPQIRFIDDDTTKLEFNKLGIYKNRYWEFQKEWRYMLFFVPYSYKESMEAMKNFNLDNLLWKIEKCPDLPFNYFFLKLRKDALNKMEILLSPKINDGNKHIVDLLIKEHNININVMPSKLTGKIK